MLRKPLLIAAIATAAGALGFSTQASAHDPVAGAIIGGAIGAAAGGPPGAAAGAIIGGILGSADGHYHYGYRGAPYYAPPPAYYAPPPAYYQPGPAYYAPPAAYYAPPAYYAGPTYYAPARAYYAPPIAYRPARVHGYAPRYAPRGHYGAYNGRHDGGRYRNGYDRRR